MWKRYTNRQAFILFLCYQRYSFLQTLHCQVFFCQLQQWVIRMLFMQYSDHSGTTACNFYPTGIHSSRPFVHYLCREMLVEYAEVRVNVSAVTLLLGTNSNFVRKTDISITYNLCFRLRLPIRWLLKWVSTPNNKQYDSVTPHINLHILTYMWNIYIFLEHSDLAFQSVMITQHLFVNVL